MKNKILILLLTLLMWIPFFVKADVSAPDVTLSKSVKVPYAKVEIKSRTKITSDMIDYMSVSSDTVKKNKNIITDSKQVIGKYASDTIPANSLFYSQNLMSKDELPDNTLTDIKDGYTIYDLNIRSDKSYVNAVYPGDYIDLYVKTKDQSEKIVFGKIVGSIEVLALRDINGNYTTTIDNSNHNKIASLMLAVPEDLYLLLTKASYLIDTEIIPVPRNASFSANAEDTRVSSDYIRNIINNKGLLDDSNLPDVSDSEISNEPIITDDELDTDVPEPNIKPSQDDDDNSKITLGLVIISVACSLIGTFAVITTVVVIVLLNEKKKKKKSEEVL